MNEISKLEQFALRIQEIADAFVEASERAVLLADQEKNFMSSLMITLEKKEFHGQKVSEAKLERLVRGSDEFQEYVHARIMAESAALRLQVKRDDLNRVWESKRSINSNERAKINSGIFAEGRG